MRVALALFALVAACETTRPCRDQTLLATVVLDDKTAPADQLTVNVLVDGTALPPMSIAHVPGETSGSVEIDFANGYPATASVTVEIDASASGQKLGSGTLDLVAPAGCAAITVDVSGT